MTAMTLRPRKEPRQARSRKRVGLILDTTAGLLVECGVDAVTTDLIAKRAGIPVGSVYQFFPNKYSILYALAARQADRFIAMAEASETLAAAPTWQEWMDSYLEVSARFLQSDDAIHVLWSAMNTIPELAEVEVEGARRAAAMLGAALARFLPQLPAKQCAYLTRTSAVVATALLYHATHDAEGELDRIVVDLKLILKHYIESYASPGALG